MVSVLGRCQLALGVGRSSNYIDDFVHWAYSKVDRIDRHYSAYLMKSIGITNSSTQAKHEVIMLQ